jgi:hypothetical protein
MEGRAREVRGEGQDGGRRGGGGLCKEGHLNSFTAKSVLAGEKLILFGRYVLNFYVGIVQLILYETKTWRAKYLPKDTTHKSANIN